MSELRSELWEKEMKLTDIRLEALNSAHQLDQLRETMHNMQVSPGRGGAEGRGSAIGCGMGRDCKGAGPQDQAGLRGCGTGRNVGIGCGLRRSYEEGRGWTERGREGEGGGRRGATGWDRTRDLAARGLQRRSGLQDQAAKAPDPPILATVGGRPVESRERPAEGGPGPLGGLRSWADPGIVGSTLPSSVFGPGSHPSLQPKPRRHRYLMGGRPWAGEKKERVHPSLILVRLPGYQCCCKPTPES